MVRYIYRLIYPVIYLTEVFPDRIVFSDSSNPDGSMVLLRSDISWFYVQVNCSKGTPHVCTEL